MKLDLAKEKERIRKYIVRRIRDYPKYVNLGPGNDEDPIQAVYLGFYAAQGGYRPHLANVNEIASLRECHAPSTNSR
jgi:hypothetical protein